MCIIIGGDLVPTNSNKKLFVEGNVEALVGKELEDIFKIAKCRIFNLEVPLSNVERPIEKYGPNLIASEETINGIKAIGTDVLVLANNHILDQDTMGLDSTCKILKKNGIKYIGVGNSLKEASRPYVFEFNNKKIGVYACVEHEFSIVTNERPGANPFDPFSSLIDVKNLKKICDYVIVLYHGGKEYYRYPSFELQKTCRSLIQNGADLVVCQHSHCVGCEEKYNDGTIVYGQGNFLFDKYSNEYWENGILIKISETFDVEYIPIVRNENAVRLANSIEKETILNGFASRSEEIKESEFMKASYKKFAKDKLDEYLWIISGAGESIVLRAINKITGYRFYKWYVKKIYSKKTRLALLNYMECEAHRELIISALKSE